MEARIEELELKVSELSNQVTESQVRIGTAEKLKKVQDHETLRWQRKYRSAVVMTEEVKSEAGSKVLSMEGIKNQPDVVKFYTGFSSYSDFIILHQFLAHDLGHLQYWGSNASAANTPVKGRNRILSSEDELLLVLARLRVGLLVEDLSFR